MKARDGMKMALPIVAAAAIACVVGAAVLRGGVASASPASCSPTQAQYDGCEAEHISTQSCGAGIDRNTLYIGIWLSGPDTSYIDVLPPVGPVTIIRGAFDAVFTPDGHVDVTCTGYGSHGVNSVLFGSWPSGAFTGSGGCVIGRGGNEAGGGARVFVGEGDVTTDNVAGHPETGAATITCHATYRSTMPLPHQG